MIASHSRPMKKKFIVRLNLHVMTLGCNSIYTRVLLLTQTIPEL